jgi:thiamine pyrophosphate-dependent acetolactate synthase large subunit-like protein
MQQNAGIENAFSGVAQAYGDSVPILVFPGQAEIVRTDVPPNFDAVSTFRNVTKWAAQINASSRVPELMRRAFTMLRTGRPGPVLLELPDDIAAAEIDSSFGYSPVRGSRPGPDLADVRRSVALLFQAKRPVVIAGGGVHAAGAWHELRTLAELLCLPVMTTMNGKSALPDNHPLALGVGGLTATAMVDHFLRRADFILAVGTSLTRWWMSAPIPLVPIVQCTIDERDLAKDEAIEQGVLGDAQLVLAAIVEEIERELEQRSPACSDPTSEIAAIKRAWLQAWMPKLTSDEVPLNPYRVVWDLMHTVRRAETIVTHDSGNPRDQLAPFYETTVPQGYLGWGHSTQLGYSLGLAMGVKLARPNHTVVNVMGDAALGMVGMDIETASRSGIGIVTILLNNSAMGNYEDYIPIAIERYDAKSLSGDYSAVGSALGAWTVKVAQPEEIVPAIQQGLDVAASGRPVVIEVITREEGQLSRYW